MARGINWTLVLGAAAVVGVVYLIKKSSGAVAGATNAVSTGIANAYLALTMQPPIPAAGSVDDQSGNLLGPIASFPSAHDNHGNTYLAINGAWYQLGPRDASGNFTAIPTGQAVSS